MHVIVVIVHITAVCVSMTSPRSLNRSTTFL